MIIEVRKDETDPTYTVRIGDDVWEMSAYANQPNGVCIYSGPVIKDFPNQNVPKLISMVPIGIVIQIAKLVEEEFEAIEKE